MHHPDALGVGIWLIVVGLVALLFAIGESDGIGWRIAKAIVGVFAISAGIAAIVA